VSSEQFLSDRICCRHVEIDPSDAAALGFPDECSHQAMRKASITVTGLHGDAVQPRDTPPLTVKLYTQYVRGEIMRLCDDECNRGRLTQISAELSRCKAVSSVVGDEDGTLKTSEVVNILQPG
jgi:hypothetical protein